MRLFSFVEACYIQVERVKLLLKQGADIEVCDDDGWTPLHWAVTHSGAPEVATLLLDRVANIESRLGNGPALLRSVALMSKMPIIIELLLNGGSGASAQSGDGRTSFDCAREGEHLKDAKTYWLLAEDRLRWRQLNENCEGFSWPGKLRQNPTMQKR